jgi:hypothetical protein
MLGMAPTTRFLRRTVGIIASTLAIVGLERQCNRPAYKRAGLRRCLKLCFSISTTEASPCNGERATQIMSHFNLAGRRLGWVSYGLDSNVGRFQSQVTMEKSVVDAQPYLVRSTIGSRARKSLLSCGRDIRLESLRLCCTKKFARTSIGQSQKNFRFE